MGSAYPALGRVGGEDDSPEDPNEATSRNVTGLVKEASDRRYESNSCAICVAELVRDAAEKLRKKFEGHWNEGSRVDLKFESCGLGKAKGNEFKLSLAAISSGSRAGSGQGSSAVIRRGSVP